MSEKNSVIGAELAAAVTEAIKASVAAIDGFETVEVRFYKEYGSLNVTAFVWKKGGVDLNDCELVHNALSTELDKFEEMLPDKYTLNVSSPGLDRPVVSDDDFRRAIGTEIEVVSSDNKKLHGVLKAYSENEITLTLSGKKSVNVIVKRINMTKVQPYIGF